ncbi:hypothetical protein GGR42_000800 [Saonia flava]|uniref:Spermatogenesis-associated protein 20-like TRX domain-containing protein n=1 Tax=Saonia flava TaxID=523696 RepID=A0A846QQF4_9FLAO|nr:thioredoxin domain-containing protein [Saonia flava]NJB70338.1 hypothetical protein [Saonia flava]
MIKDIYIKVFVLVLLVFTACKEKAQNIEEEKHKFTNELISETSPYLLQHAHNPVNWRAWSQEALDQAEKENKLVLISVGYSSCHWCHVMEEETFEDEEVAKMMNENFINIKVDREERPDVDNVYMTAVQLMTGGGGWPLNVIALPNGKPIYGNTYHTKQQWTDVLTRISDLYKTDPDKAHKVANSIAEGVQNVNIVDPSSDHEGLTENVVTESIRKWKPKWDHEWGGNLGSQKFPKPVSLSFLLDYSILTGDESAKKHVKNTLDKIAIGGMYDHLAGGFYRYSVDNEWRVPHFEKMLYDNAQLLSLYSKAYMVYKEPEYKYVVEETIAFLNREMKNADGAYYATLDADSDGEEGKFYVWKEDELKTILKDDFELFANYFGVEGQNVWENGNFVLRKDILDSVFCEKQNIELAAFETKKKKWKNLLLAKRANRVRPGVDDKIITSWNALLINGFVDAYKAFGKDIYLENAVSTFNYIKKNSYNDNQLQHSYKEGGKRTIGFLEDYTFLANAALNLYGTTLDNNYLKFAQKLTSIVEADFKDETSGMYRYNKEKSLIATLIRTDDGDIPSANAMMAHNLFNLGHINYDVRFLDKAKNMLSSMKPLLIEYADSYAKWDALLLNIGYPFYEIAVVGENANTLMTELNGRFIPNTLTVGSTTKSDLPLFKNRYEENETYIYVCRNNACKLPVTNVETAIEQINNF